MSDRAKDIFYEALDQQAVDRQGYVERACRGDAELRAKVNDLLDAHARAGHFLASPTVDVADADAGGLDDRPQIRLKPDVGDAVGPYTLIERLGEGGFGIVFLAEQSAPVRRRVALKLMRSGYESEQFLARFAAERQALALMDHPSIARVYDAGETDEGRPFFVMELVKGVPITTYCDQNHVPMRERLSLFRDVCMAIQHAHFKGIIHRDIKPNNVLVTLQDGQPMPKVIDFGVAKAMHAPLTERPIVTEVQQFIGTPQYMSPEQSRAGMDVDARSDIYALGVLLYELLVGVTPLDAQRASTADAAELQRMICDHEPPRPSARLSQIADGDTAEIAHRRSTDAAQLRRHIKGEIDWIVMKALEKDRTRRYPTASALADDVERFLSGDPVEAAPPSTWYRTVKMVKRHRTASIAAAAVAVAVLVGLAVATAGFISANRSAKLATEAQLEEKLAREDAERQADAARKAEQAALAAEQEAKRQAEIAEAVNQFLNEDLLAAAAPSAEAGKGRDVKMRDVIDVAADRIDDASAPGGKFADKPLVEAGVRQALAGTYVALGVTEMGERQLRRVLEIYQNAGDAEGLASTKSNLGQVMLVSGNFAEARRLLDEAQVELENELGGDHEKTNFNIRRRASLARRTGDYPEAIELYRRAIDGLTELHGAAHEETIRAMSGLAITHARNKDTEEAEQMFRRVLELRKEVLGPEAPGTLASTNNLAAFLRSQRRDAEAEPLLRDMLETQDRIMGAEHPDSLMTRHNLAGVLGELQRYDEAEELGKSNIDAAKRVLGEDHPRTIAMISNLAQLYRDQMDIDRAEPLQKEAYEAALRTLGDTHPLTLGYTTNLADIHIQRERYDEAYPLMEHVYLATEKRFGKDHPSTIQSITNLALICRKMDDYARSEELLLDAMDRAIRRFGDESLWVGQIHGDLASSYNQADQPVKSEPHGAKAVEVLSKFHRPEHADVAVARLRHGIALTAMKRFDEAEAELLDANGHLESGKGLEASPTQSVVKALVSLYRVWPKHEQASAWEAKWLGDAAELDEISDE